MNTTLNNIRKHSPCKNSWEKLLASLNKTQADDEALPLRYVLDTLGLVDAIWALRSLEGADREIRLFACDCAERVLHVYEAEYPNDTRSRNAIEVARKYANGDATNEELYAAWAAAAAAAAAMGAAMGAAAAAAAAASALGAARDAAWAAADAVWAERESQNELFIKYFC